MRERRIPRCVLALLLAALTAEGCVMRTAPLPEAPETTPAPAEEAVFVPVSPEITPEPTPEVTPEPTPCGHPAWENGVCLACGAVCPHASWAGGKCGVCGIPCSHEKHDRTSLRCLTCGEIAPHAYEKNVCVRCGVSPVFFDKVLPREFFFTCRHRGEVVTLTYTTDAYTPTGSQEPQELEKKMLVYLPYGYSEEEQYDLLILLHGSGCTEHYWLEDTLAYAPGSLEEVFTRDLLDNLIETGHSRKVIVATPTFYRYSDAQGIYNRMLDQPRFMDELRNDILPLLVEKYSTYAASGSSEDISAARAHFAFAGLSLGSIYGFTGTLPECVDLFGWYGLFSGSDGYMDMLAETLNTPPDSLYPIYYFYNSIGVFDPYYWLHKGQYAQLVGYANGLTEGENAAFTEIQGVGHEYAAWAAGLTNFLSVAFSLPESGG